MEYIQSKTFTVSNDVMYCVLNYLLVLYDVMVKYCELEECATNSVKKCVT